jgi:hypothetical protein
VRTTVVLNERVITTAAVITFLSIYRSGLNSSAMKYSQFNDDGSRNAAVGHPQARRSSI